MARMSAPQARRRALPYLPHLLFLSHESVNDVAVFAGLSISVLGWPQGVADIAAVAVLLVGMCDTIADFAAFSILWPSAADEVAVFAAVAFCVTVVGQGIDAAPSGPACASRRRCGRLVVRGSVAGDATRGKPTEGEIRAYGP